MRSSLAGFAKGRRTGAFVAAILFALHPVNVESVAWIAERKNLLAMFFFLLTVYCYERSLEGPWEGKTLRRLVVGEPFRRPLGSAQQRLNRHDSGRSPDFAMVAPLARPPPVGPTACLCCHRGLSHRSQCMVRAPSASRTAARSDLLGRLLGAAAVIWFYLGKAVLPRHLVFVYPTWTIHTTDFRWWLPLVAVGALTAILFKARERWSHPLWGFWVYFCVTLLPVLGLTDVYFMRYSLVADHYQHLALIGVVALGGAALARLATKSRLLATTVAVTAALLLVLQTRSRVPSYASSETLFRATIKKNPDAWLAENNLGIILLNEGKTEEAIACLRKALSDKPDYAEAHVDLGNALRSLGRVAEAALEYRAALATPSTFDREAHLNLGHLFYDSGRLDEAAREYRASLAQDRGYAEAHYSLGNVAFSRREYEDAVLEYKAAIRFDPEMPDVHNNLGSALMMLGQASAAATEYQIALRQKPGDASTSSNLAAAEMAAKKASQR